MRKNLTIFCVLALSLFFVGNAFAQNANAYFKIDTNLTTVGYQDTSLPGVMNIGASKQVGFAIYGINLEDVAGVSVTFEWDGAKATRTSGNIKISAGSVDINGSTQTIAAEAGVLGSSVINAGEKDETGFYSNTIARQGTGTTASTALLYYTVFTTAGNFKVGDQLTIKATVSISAANGKEKPLGTRYFTVNTVDVKNTKWGDVKSQFKNF